MAVSAWHSSACLNNKGEVYLWGTNQCLKPTKITEHNFSEVKVGGNFTLLADSDGHIMQTSSGAKPHYVQGIEENFSHSLCVGGNFAFVIGKATISGEGESHQNSP